MNSFLNLADNPLFVKHVRARLRKQAILPALIIIGFLSICIVWADQTFGTDHRGVRMGVGSHCFFWLQMIILMLVGGSQVASSVAYVKESGILDFHRVTPVPSSVQVLGFLLGAPIREYLLFAFTIPFALVCALIGPWGLLNFVKLLLVQITAALLYHSIAVVTGLSGKSAKGASGRFVGIIVILNIVSNQFNAAGSYGPAMLSPLPVYMEVTEETIPLGRGRVNQVQVNPPRINQIQANQPQANQQQGDPRFFSVAIPLAIQTLMFQLPIFVFLFIASSRRFRSNRLPLYTKVQATTFLSVIAFLVLGSQWERSATTIILSASYFLMFISLWLISTVTVPSGEYKKGIQRAKKMGWTHTPVWSDLASNKVVAVIFGMIFLGAMLSVIGFAPLQNRIQGNLEFSPWGPMILGPLTVLSYAFAYQYFHLRYEKRGPVYFGLYIFFIWIAPIMVGGLLALSQIKESLYLMAISPLLGVGFSGATAIPQLDPDVLRVIAIAPAAVLTLIYGVFLIRREHDIKKEIFDEPTESESKRKSEEVLWSQERE
jgi:hypothetical protein